MTDRRLDAALQAALDHLQRGLTDVLDRVLVQLPNLAAASTNSGQRQALIDAERFLQGRRGVLQAGAVHQLRQQIDKWARASEAGPLSESSQPDWSSLSLVDHAEVERTVVADRLAQSVATACEGSLSVLHAQFGALTAHSEHQPHPIRPQAVTQALLDTFAQEGVDQEALQALLGVLSRLLPEALATAYADIVADWRRLGLTPAAPAVRRSASSTSSVSGTLSAPTSPGGLSGVTQPQAFATTSAQAGLLAASEAGQRAARVLSDMFGVPAPALGSWNAAPAGGDAAAAVAGGLTDAATSADFQDLLRRIAAQALPPVQVHAAMAGGASAGATLTGLSGTDAVAAGFAGPLMAPNVIRAHRDELIQARGGAPLDQMIIDIVAALFDQVLSDPKVAPQMARQIARLQMPVLRVALSDTRFFSSRRHPVRRFVNRIASLSAAFDELDSGAGQECVHRVTLLVNDVVEGDFDRMELYETKLAELEAFIEELQRQDGAEHDDVTTLLRGKEADLRVHQRYMQLLQRELSGVELPEFLRAFLTQIWSQVQVMAASRDGAQSALASRMKEAGRELALSVQPKGHPQLRKEFLLKLPRLMRDLNEGLALIQWPEEAKQAFFSQLLPAHAECLKATPSHELTQRLLEHQLTKVEQIAIPSREEAANDPLPAAMHDPGAAPALTVVPTLTSEEMAQAGFVPEAAVTDEAVLDINLCEPPDHDPALVELDIDLDTPPPPSQGLQLVHHIQKGTAYQMMMQGQWKKVRLTWVSEGRTFFIFTHGHLHKQTISLTARTLAKMCDTGRFRAFEQAELIERATVRARRQLAALQPGPRTRSAA
ncbi:DUF1631 family protein [Aquabacterium fontiphilum]|uniref:DUF1631 family protein n=1 Tax=Aquabacterium fontiphilum TaxID=450365 RepID=UPI0013778AAB|nr:DUF1631 family protein [Aquabacterium fontiphilum]